MRFLLPPRTALGLLLGVLLLISLRAGALPPSDLAILPAMTLATNVAVANSDFYTPGLPGVASDGTNYLVVSCRFDSPPLGLFGVLLSPRGDILNSFFITTAGQFAFEADTRLERRLIVDAA